MYLLVLLFFTFSASPVVSSFSPTMLVVGDNATLTCSTSFNYPLGNVTWSRTDGGDPLPTNRFTVAADGTLLVSPVAMGDEGLLTCAVTNQYGRSFVTTQITVQCKWTTQLNRMF